MGYFLTIDYDLISIQHKTIVRLNIYQSYCISSNAVQPKTYLTKSFPNSSTIPALKGCYLTIDYYLKSIQHKTIIKLNIKEPEEFLLLKNTKLTQEDLFHIGQRSQL